MKKVKMKQFVKRIIPSKYHEKIVRLKNDLLDGHAVKSYSQEGEDMILNRLFNNKRDGFYVDVGAHHPKRFSNTYFFYKLGWRGINIEPNPDNYEIFEKQRRRDINLRIGVSDQPGFLSYYMFDEPALNTFNEEIASEQSRNNERYHRTGQIQVEVQRLDTILRQYMPENTTIDFMTIDVEGCDMNVLLSNDWNMFRPNILLVEERKLDLGNYSNSDINSFLRKTGYSIFAKTVNTLIFRENKFDLP